MKRYAMMLAAVLALTSVTASLAQQSGDEKQAMKKLEKLLKEKDQQAEKEKQDDKQEEPKSGEGLVPRVKIATSLGDIVLDLNGKKAPITVQNFLDYADADFYQGTVFHRVMANFMIQAGQFTPELEKKTEGLEPAILNEWQNGLTNDRGTIAMARTQAPDSAQAQFFINVVDNDNLDKPISGGAGYAVFGKVVDGMDVVDKIRQVETHVDPKLPMGKVVPVEPVVIKDVTVVRACDRKALAAAAEKKKTQIEKDRREAAEREARAAAERAEKEAAMVEEFIAKTEAETGKEFQQTDSGLRYLVLEEGDGASPGPTDRVKVHYTGTFVDGKEFDSSHRRGQPAQFPLNGVISCWQEAVGMMKVGGKWKIICPPDIAYGERGRGPIPGNATLIFDVELLDIVGG